MQSIYGKSKQGYIQPFNKVKSYQYGTNVKHTKKGFLRHFKAKN